MSSQSEASIDWTTIGDSLKNMISKLGMEESDFDIVVDNSQSSSDKVLKIDNAIRNCTENIVLAIGNCSDIAEAVGFKGLDGEEGSINRLKDCTEKVATRLAEREEEMERAMLNLSEPLDRSPHILPQLQEGTQREGEKKIAYVLEGIKETSLNIDMRMVVL